jgi:hypothetical protein
MRAHSKLIESGNDTFYSESTLELAQRAVRESNKDSNGERESDALTKALQTKQQRGRVHCVCSKFVRTRNEQEPEAPARNYRNWTIQF